MASWELEVATNTLTGALADMSTVKNIASGSFTLADGYYQGNLVLEDQSLWVMNGLLSPDTTFFAGFAYPEDWDGHWHDFYLTR